VARAGDEPTPFEPAGRSRTAWIVFVVCTIVFLAADLGSKYVAFRTIADQPVTVHREQVLEIMATDPPALQSLVPRHEPVVVVPYGLEFKLLLNAGAVFGAGSGKRVFFITFTLAALAFAVYLFARWTHRRDTVSHVAIALIASGGLGNLYDRILYACVRDFLHPLPGVQIPFGLQWPGGGTELWPYVSNVADAFLLIGIGLILLRFWRAETPAGRPKDDAETKSPQTPA
jgi:lipoprotein signal peptidase